MNRKLKYNGYCAFALSNGHVDVKGNNSFLRKNENVYVFSDVVAKLLFIILPKRQEKADRMWNEINQNQTKNE